MAGRTEERLERSRARKVDRMLENTSTIPPGKSIMEMLIEQLDAAAGRYIDGQFHGTQKEVLIARGEVRGLARALSLMMNPYHPTRGIKELEKAAINRVKEKRNAEEAADQEVDAE